MSNPRIFHLRHLLILLTALGLLPIILLSVWSINATIAQQQREFERSMLDLSRALASAVDAELDANISALRAISSNPFLANGNLREFYASTREIVQARPSWNAIVLTDGKGNLLFKTVLPFGADDGKIIDPDSLALAIATREPVVGRIAKGQRQQYAIPVRLPMMINGELRYVLTAAIKPDRILEIVRRQRIPDDWVISVQDAHNLRVARSRDHENTIATGISPSLAELIGDGKPEGAGISRTLEGTEAITTFARVPSHGWMVVIGAPTEPLKQSMWRRLMLFGAGIAASLAACILLAILISRKIAKAIDDLKVQAVRLGHGQPLTFSKHAIHEINQIGSALVAASEERIAIEKERETLMQSLNAALAEAEEAGRAKDNFLAVLGHELRNPLAPMVTALELMKLKGGTANQRECEIMQRQVSHMRRLVDDMLDVSRITQGKLEIRKEAVNLRSVIERAVETMQPALAGRGRPLKVSAASDAWVNGDETRLTQVLTNLLSNALRFDPDGEIAVSLSDDGRQAHIVVRDEGAGMEPETVERIFGAFYQAPQPLARSSGGLGLGLAIVRSIVELHDGQVSASSAGPGKGSVFDVCLPLIAAPAAKHEVSTQDRQTSSGARILVVDDNVDAAQTVSDLLKMAGHEVMILHDAKSALEMFAGFAPDAAMLDIGLPGTDGFELARKICERFPAWHGKLIALTGYGQMADKIKAAEAGFDLHLTKPVEFEELLRAVGNP